MAYGKVPDVFWAQTRSLSDDARQVELYLRTGPHRKRLGIGIVDPYYIVADLAWEDVARVREALAELQGAGRIGWDPEARVVLVMDTLQVDPPLRNEQAVMGAIQDLESVPDTPLFTALLVAVEACVDPAKAHHVLLVESVRRRLPPPPKEPKKPTPPKGSVERSVERSVEPSVERPLIAVQASSSHSTSSPSTSKPTTREIPQREVEAVWKAVENVVLTDWHQGSETVDVGNGKPVGMGAERLNVAELVQAYGAEETVGAIRVGPRLFDFPEPHTLRWYTSREHGSANFERALGEWHKSRPPGPAVDVQVKAMPTPVPTNSGARQQELRRQVLDVARQGGPGDG